MEFPNATQLETDSWSLGRSFLKQIAFFRTERALKDDFKQSPSSQVKQESWDALRECDKQVLALSFFGLTNDEIAAKLSLKNSRVVVSSVVRASNALGIDKAKRDEIRSGLERLSNPRQIPGYREVQERDALIDFFYDKEALVKADSNLMSFSPSYIAKLIKSFIKNLDDVDQKIFELEFERGLKSDVIAPKVSLHKSRVFSRATAYKKQIRDWVENYLSLKKWMPRQLDPHEAALLSKKDLAILRAFLRDDDFVVIAKDQAIAERTVHNRLANIAKSFSLSREEFYEIKDHNLNKRDFNFLYGNLLRFLFPPHGVMPQKFMKLAMFDNKQSLFKTVISEVKNFNPRTNKRYFKLMLQGYSQGAISRKLGISQSSISVSLSRTRKRLLDFLENKLKKLTQ